MPISRNILVTCTLLFALLGSGCRKNTFFNLAAPPPPTKLAKKHPGYTLEDYIDNKSEYKKRIDSNDTAGALRIRNDIAAGLIKDVDLLFSAYETGLLSGKGESGIIEDAITLGLAAGATISNVKATKTILSALVTAFTGVNLSYEKNLFAQQSFPVIALAMRTRREKLLTNIQVKLQQLDLSKYSEAQVETDIFAYAQAGTLAEGLVELQDEAGIAAAKQKDITKTALDAK